MRKFYRTTIKIVVLSEYEYNPSSLDRVRYDITEGDCSGIWNITKREKLTPKVMARALRMQSSDPEFFMLDKHGNDIQDD